MPSPKEKPYAECTGCGTPTANVSVINQSCNLMKQTNGEIKKCKGVYRSKIGNNDWEMCPFCLGNGDSCSVCKGYGWVTK